MPQRRFSRRAYQQAMRRFPRRPMFPGGRPVTPGHRPGGYQGLDDLIARLSQGNITQQQMDRMAEGRTGGGGWGSIGGMGGLASGLSPYATHWLATSGVLKKNEFAGTPLEGLEGPELFRAQLMNSLGQQNYDANPTYDLAEGIDQDFLAQIFGMGFGGKSAYEKGFGAEGRLPGQGPVGGPWRPPIRKRRRPGQTPPIKRRGPGPVRRFPQPGPGGPGYWIS